MLENGEFTGWKGEGGGNPRFIVWAVSIILFYFVLFYFIYFILLFNFIFLSGNALGQGRGSER